MPSLNVAFYAPMKSPRHPTPSGDRRIARLLLKALRAGGCKVDLASNLRSWEGEGDAEQQQRIRKRAEARALQLTKTYQGLPRAARPALWFTYHVYHKAPDWIGPCVCRAMNIPYVAVEASVAKKQMHGAWRAGYQQSLDALNLAQVIFHLNPRDREGVAAVSRARMPELPPFLDAPATMHTRDKRAARDALQAQGVVADINKNDHWLVCAAMMRDDAKLKSFAMLARALQLLRGADWRLLIIGDGAAEARVRELFQSQARAHFLGRLNTRRVFQIMQSADLFVWPAINEAVCMAALEALACGLPAVVGDASGGLRQIVQHNRGGKVVRIEDGGKEFAEAIESLLANPATLANMAAHCRKQYREQHTLQRASELLMRELLRLV